MRRTLIFILLFTQTLAYAGGKKTIAELTAKVEKGDSIAAYQLAYDYYFGFQGVKKDLTMARLWYGKGAEMNLLDAQVSYATMCYYGIGGEVDQVSAAKWWGMAAGQDDAEAQMLYGQCLFNGEGVEQNKEEAVKWYRKAADKDNPQACYYLGCCQEDGDGTKVDSVSAAYYFMVAAEAGVFQAQLELANMYFEGHGVDRNFHLATYWYKMAARKSPFAQFRVGYCYYMGIGVAKDLYKAEEYLEAAEENGIPQAKTILSMIREQEQNVTNGYNE